MKNLKIMSYRKLSGKDINIYKNAKKKRSKIQINTKKQKSIKKKQKMVFLLFISYKVT